MIILGCDNKKSGIPRIEIPVKLSELDEELLCYYLPDCVKQLKQNAKKIQYLKDFVDGTHQEIDDRTLELKTSGKANHKIKENHSYEIVQFKEGFRLGNKRQLVNKEGIENNDVAFIEKFMTDAGCESKIMEWVHDLYSTGIATTFIMQRGDIYSDNGKDGANRKVTYLNADNGYDVKVNAPFVYETVNSEENAVVYSSCIGESGLKDLFCINLANVLNRQTKTKEEVVTVYTREKIYEWRQDNGAGELKVVGNNAIYGELPMTEHSLNKTRISPIEVIYDMLNAVNLLVSLEINSAEDKVNKLLVFINCDIGDDFDIDELYKSGALALTGNMGDRQPDVKTISNDLDYSKTSVLKEQLLTRMFDIIGVPLASASVSSGNNEAAYLGGGWTNANIIMNRDIVYGERTEREELRKIIKICKLNPENPVQSIHANEIDIKYNINQSNNYVAKSQAMQNLNDIGFDIADIIKAIPFFNDEEGVAKRCKANQEKKAEQEQEATEQTQQTALTGDNLTGQQKQQQADQTQAEQAGGVE